MSEADGPVVVFGWQNEDDEALLREVQESLARDGGVNLLALNRAYLRGLLVPASDLAVAHAEIARLSERVAKAPAIDPARVVAVGNLDADLLVVYIDGIKAFDADDCDASGAHSAILGLGIEFRTIVVWYEDGLPDSLEELIEADARVRRWECDDRSDIYIDPKDGSRWTVEGRRIEDGEDV